MIVTEKKPGKDGHRGAMSLCNDCLTVFNGYEDMPNVTVTLL